MPTNTPIATERFSDRRLNFNVDLLKWTARRGFDVAYAAHEAEAYAAVAAQLGVYMGGPHDLSANLTCVNLNADKSLFTVIRVIADYGVNTGAFSSEDPLGQPPKILWTPTLQSAPLTHTPDGNAITTAAGQPFDIPSQGDINTMALTITRNQPFYDPIAATQVIDTINSDSFVIKGKPMNAAVSPGQARCKSIAPVGEYFLSAKFVKVAWRFEIRPSFSTDALGFSDAWDEVRINQGTMGWFDNGSGKKLMGYFYTSDHKMVTGPVPLDKNGVPFDTDSYKVTADLKDAISNPTPLIGKNPGDIRFLNVPAPAVKGGQIIALHFRRFLAIPFSGLL